MREIKFRGVNTITEKWVYGTYLKHQIYMPYPIGTDHNKEEDYTHLILTSGFADWGMKRGIDCSGVYEESVGQYTGIKDKNGKEIYEGDIIKYSHKAVGKIQRVVSYKYGMYGIKGTMKETHIPFANILQSEYEVIGNIYENPELLVED